MKIAKRKQPLRCVICRGPRTVRSKGHFDRRLECDDCASQPVARRATDGGSSHDFDRHEERIAFYRERAEAGVPLFTEADAGLEIFRKREPRGES